MSVGWLFEDGYRGNHRDDAADGHQGDADGKHDAEPCGKAVLTLLGGFAALVDAADHVVDVFHQLPVVLLHLVDQHVELVGHLSHVVETLGNGGVGLDLLVELGLHGVAHIDEGIAALR